MIIKNRSKLMYLLILKRARHIKIIKLLLVAFEEREPMHRHLFRALRQIIRDQRNNYLYCGLSLYAMSYS